MPRDCRRKPPCGVPCNPVSHSESPTTSSKCSELTSRSVRDIESLAGDLRAGNHAALARAITLVESRRGDHQAAARDLVQALLYQTGKAVGGGRTGAPRL